jgi:hypothetical protein
MLALENIDPVRFQDRDPDPAKNSRKDPEAQSPAYNDEIEDLLVLGSAALLGKFRGNVYLLSPHHHLRERQHIKFNLLNLSGDEFKGHICALKLIYRKCKNF